MSDLFHNASAWLRFAEEHNNQANPNAIQLNGSDSYTLAAIHQSAGIPLPKSILLDTKRAHGKFVADHFTGLRKLYEKGQASSRWLPGILEKCHDIGRLHAIDGDIVIQKLIAMTERSRRSTRSGRGRALPEPFPLKKSVSVKLDAPDDIKI